MSSNNFLVKRIIYTFIVLICVFVWPWQGTLIASSIGLLVFPWYLEVILPATLVELFYAPNHVPYHSNPWVIALVSLLILEVFMKPRLRLYVS